MLDVPCRIGLRGCVPPLKPFLKHHIIGRKLAFHRWQSRNSRENQVLGSYRVSLPLLSIPLCLSIGLFYDSFGSVRDVPSLSSAPFLPNSPVQPSNVRLDMHVVCGEGMERDGSASLSVLTGKYLSRHTPPPSTTVDHRQPPPPPSPRSHPPCLHPFSFTFFSLPFSCPRVKTAYEPVCPWTGSLGS